LIGFFVVRSAASRPAMATWFESLLVNYQDLLVARRIPRRVHKLDDPDYKPSIKSSISRIVFSGSSTTEIWLVSRISKQPFGAQRAASRSVSNGYIVSNRPATNSVGAAIRAIRGASGSLSSITERTDLASAAPSAC